MNKIMEYLNLIEQDKYEFQIRDNRFEERNVYISAINHINEITDFNKFMEQIRTYVDEEKIIPYIICKKDYEDIIYYFLKGNLLKKGVKNNENLSIRIIIKDSIEDGDYILIFGLPYNIIIHISYDAVKEPRYSYFKDISIYHESDYHHITMLSYFFI